MADNDEPQELRAYTVEHDNGGKYPIVSTYQMTPAHAEAAGILGGESAAVRKPGPDDPEHAFPPGSHELDPLYTDPEAAKATAEAEQGAEEQAKANEAAAEPDTKAVKPRNKARQSTEDK